MPGETAADVAVELSALLDGPASSVAGVAEAAVALKETLAHDATHALASLRALPPDAAAHPTRLAGGLLQHAACSTATGAARLAAARAANNLLLCFALHVDAAAADALVEAAGGLPAFVRVLDSRGAPELLGVVAKTVARLSFVSSSFAEAAAHDASLAAACLSIVAQCVRSTAPPFPEGAGRVELAQECLTLLQLRSRQGAASVGAAEAAQLALLVVDIVSLPARAVAGRCETLLAAAVQTTMYMGSDTPVVPLLACTPGCAAALCYWLARSARRVVVDKTSKGDADVGPLLMVLHRVCSASSGAAQAVRCLVFGPVPEGAESPVLPVLTALLRMVDSRLKRFAGELLFLLCGSSGEAYVAKVGMGLAIPILQAHGITMEGMPGAAMTPALPRAASTGAGGAGGAGGPHCVARAAAVKGAEAVEEDTEPPDGVD